MFIFNSMKDLKTVGYLRERLMDSQFTTTLLTTDSRVYSNLLIQVTTNT